MRPRIKTQKHPVLIYTTSQDKEKQSLAKFNRDKYLKSSDVNYIGFTFGRAHKITKEEYIVVNVAKRAYTNTFLDKHMLNSSTAEIDLHIGELVEDYYLLENDQMLKIQIEYARKCLNEAIIQGLSKIIFIHGVGQGILKSELIKELNKYQNIHYFDASMAKYGVGATEVYIGQNR